MVVAPQAVLFHAEAASRGVREISSTSRRPERADRAAAVFTVLANCRLPAFPVLWVRLLFGSLLRAFGYLLGKLPGAAWDELVAVVSTLGRPWRIIAARSRRRRSRDGRRHGARGLLPPWWTPYTNGLDTVLDRLSETLRQAGTSIATSARRLRSGRGDPTQLETGPVPDEAVALPTGDGALAIASRHPLLAVTVLLSVAGLIASRGLWGPGFLQGGALLPAPAGAGDWWRLAVEGGHPVGLGSGISAAPATALLALPAGLLLGKAWLALDVLMLFAPALAGIGAWAASARLARGPSARVWMSLTYGLVPVLIGAGSSGHVGTVAFAVLLPWVVRGACGVLDLSRPPRWAPAWAGGLSLSAACAFAPSGWPVAVVLGVVAIGWLLVRREFVRVVQWLLLLALPIGLLAPWSFRLLGTPELALSEAGTVDVPGTALDDIGWRLAFFRIDAVGDAPWLLTAGVVVVAGLALLRHDLWGRVAAAWWVVLVGLGAAVVMGRQVVSLPLAAGEAHPWLGVPAVVVAAGLVAAGGMAADGLGAFVGSGSFGWRQPVAALGVLVGLTAPLVGLAWWVGVADHGDLHRRVPVAVPAYMVDAMRAGDARVLVLHASASGAEVRYQVLAGDGLRLGDETVLPSRGTPRLRTVVGDLLTQPEPADLETLAGLGIGYVVLPSPQNATTVGDLDRAPGLRRTSTDQGVLSGWQVQGAVASSRAIHPHAHLWRMLGLGAGWVVVGVLAAPGIRRRPLAHDEEQR